MDDDITSTRHHHGGNDPIGTPVTGSRGDLLAILNKVDPSTLASQAQRDLLTALSAYAQP